MPINSDSQSPVAFAESLLSRLRNDPDWFLYDAVSKALPDHTLKPWDELSETQRAAIVLHVNDMSSWQADGKVDADDVAMRFEHCPELRELLA